MTNICITLTTLSALKVQTKATQNPLQNYDLEEVEVAP